MTGKPVEERTSITCLAVVCFTGATPGLASVSAHGGLNPSVEPLPNVTASPDKTAQM